MSKKGFLIFYFRLNSPFSVLVQDAICIPEALSLTLSWGRTCQELSEAVRVGVKAFGAIPVRVAFYLLRERISRTFTEPWGPRSQQAFTVMGAHL